MKNLSKKYFLIEILILFYPLSIVIGPFVSETVMTFVSLFFLLILFFKEKKFKIFNNKFFYYYLTFVIYILLNSFLSNYSKFIFLDNVFYFRFLILIFAVLFFLEKNPNLLKIFYYVLLATNGIITIDGYIQYLAGKNLIGYEVLRPDRLSGFFGDRMVLGSFLSRYFYLLLALFFLFKSKLNKNLIFFSYILFFLISLLIFFSGERAAFFNFSLGLFLLLLTLNYSFYKKILLGFSILLLLLIVGISNKTVYDRYVTQTFKQFEIFNFDKKIHFFDRFFYYSTIFETAYKGYLDNKIFGQGPKSFRYFCSDTKFETFSKKQTIIENNLIKFHTHKKFHKILVKKIYISNNVEIKKGDLLFSYLSRGKLFNFYSEKEGTITEFHFKEGDRFSLGKTLFTIDLKDSTIPDSEIIYMNGCSTHPHQFYLQLMSETGIIGTLFILSNFIFLVFILSKHFFSQFFNKIGNLNNAQLCMIINFITILFPISTAGNFFNNWLNMTFIIQISFFLFFFRNIKGNT